ncbi:YkgJ family cysteine cluster protein [bacterium]|nr:YkgJ family cysteine cluster protein [bacterium]
MRPLKTYQNLVKECDLLFKRVQHKYPADISCRKGCSDCCICGSVFAIEAYFISLYWKKHCSDKKVGLPRGNFCPFLHDRQCLIYPVRPLLCRTHGLALATITGNCLDWNSCPSNFTNGLPEGFCAADFLSIDQINNDLALLNISFCQLFGCDQDHYRISLESLFISPGSFFSQF